MNGVVAHDEEGDSGAGEKEQGRSADQERHAQEDRRPEEAGGQEDLRPEEAGGQESHDPEEDSGPEEAGGQDV